MNTIKNKLIEKLKSNFSHTPNSDQKDAINQLVDFITTIGNRSIFILKGYAGTGKTTLISSIIKSLSIVGKRSVLLAPLAEQQKYFHCTQIKSHQQFIEKYIGLKQIKLEIHT